MKNNKKIFAIAGLAFFYIFTMSIPNSVSSYEKNSTGKNGFDFTGAGAPPIVHYYLMGNFTSTQWSADSNYELEDVTSTMLAETNKIKEYKISNIHLDKGKELRIWSSDNTWYDSTYQHKWSNAVSKNGSNYVVPMTSNSYTIYFKVYSDNTTKLYITANKDILYFNPNKWADAGAWFAVNCHIGSNYVYQKLTEKTSDNYYKFEVPTGASEYYFKRMNPASQTMSDSNAWNSSGSCKIYDADGCDTNNAFMLWEDNQWKDWTLDWGNTFTWSTK